MLPRRCLVLLAFLTLSAPVLRAADPDKPLTRIAFGSFAQQDRPQPIWDKVVEARPDLFLFIGDTVYADTKDMDVMRAEYKKLADLPGWQKLRKTCPLFATWDDHDYGANDAGAEYPKKVESQQIFLDFFDEPKDSPRRKQEGVYAARVYGPEGKRVQVILLDMRYFRTALKKKGKDYVASDDPKATFLGEAQWKWLEEQLKVPAEVRLLCSSIQLVAEDHPFEKWMNFPLERERLFGLLKDTKASGVIVLSGDRHLAELSVLDAGLGYPLYDLTSSGINQGYKGTWRPLETNRRRVATMNVGDNFGLVVFDWEREEPRVTLQIHDVEGDVAIREKVPLKALKPGSLAVKGTDLAKLDTGEALTPAEAAKHVDQQVTVELTVQSLGSSGGLVFLNSAKDFKSEDNFTVVLEKEAVDALKKDGVADPKEHFKGKTVRVSGKLTIYKDRPEIKVTDPKQVEVVKK